MASTVKHLRSSTANKRPTASGLAEGQLGINTASGTPGVFFKDSAGTVTKVGPAHVGSTAPNVSPAGSAGNSLGELWVNNSTTINGLNYYTGSAFVNLTPSGTATVAGLVELATDAETQTGTDTIRAVTPSGLQSKISNSISTTSSTTIASATAVKTAYDLANAALPKAGGRVTGNLEIGPAGSLSFEGSSDDSFETTLAVVNPTAARTITLPNVTGTVVTTGDSGTVTSTMIADGTIVNADINASAAIVDTKLATIATAGKVSNSATTATNANTASAIVARDASGNFTAGTITAALTGAASSNVLKAGDTMTGALVVPLASASTPSLTFTGDLNTGIFSPGADQVGISTNGVSRLQVTGNICGVGAADAATAGLEIGQGATGNRIAYLDLIGDTTYTDHGLRLIRAGNGADSVGSLINRGTGELRLVSQDAGVITFLTTNAERARLDSSGRLLVGTSTAALASALIEAEGNAAFRKGTNVADNPTELALGRRRSNNTIVENADALSAVIGYGWDGSAYIPASSIITQVDGTPGANDMPGRLVFSVTADDSASPTEAMRINNARELLIGYTADNGAYKLQVNSQIFATSSTVATSDGRYKENVATLNGCIDLVSALRPVSFDWKPQQDITRIDDDGNSVLVREGHNFPSGKQVGFIAQEVQAVLADKPWLNSIIKQNVRPAIEDADGNELAPEEEFFGIAESNLTAVLTAALQEAIAKIEDLEARIVALEA